MTTSVGGAMPVPDAGPEEALGAAPEAALEAAPEAALEAAPETAPDAAPDDTSHAASTPLHASVGGRPPPTERWTFLFTDVEGSTAMWERDPAAARHAMSCHDEIVAAAVAAHGGSLLRHRGEGDSTFSTFASPLSAVLCAVDIQRGLRERAGPDVRVRIGIHTGSGERIGNDYRGPDVNRCARIRSCAVGGQVLLSRVTADLVRSSLPPPVSLRSLGRHRLRGISAPEEVVQVCHPDLDDVPVRRFVDAWQQTDPSTLSTFVGRDKERRVLADLVARHRLVTLAGAGGSGKTRLALQVASDVAEEFPDGVWLVEFGSLRDQALVTTAIVAALGLRQEPGREPIEVLLEWLEERRCLLVLDNCEHLLGAVTKGVAALLATLPRLTVMATSRRPLGVPGEHVWRIPPMLLPPRGRLAHGDLLAYDAVRLFSERAAAAGAAVRPEDAPVVAEICRRLDGLPLAIELAAARTAVVSVHELARRIDHRLGLLSDRNGHRVPRHRTLRAAIDWSCDLLTAAERVLFRRLSVFAGGWTLDAAEEVCSDDVVPRTAVLDLLASLVDQSLVIVEDCASRRRYRFLETIREYARERLEEAGEAGELRARHRRWALAVAESAEQRLFRAEDVSWSVLLDEQDNLRAALETVGDDATAASDCLRIAGALVEFWDMRGEYAEGRRALTTALRHADGAPPAVRAKALAALGLLVAREGDYPTARRHYEEALALIEGDALSQLRSIVLGNLGLLHWWQGDVDAADRLTEESLTTAERLGDRWLVARARSFRQLVQFQRDPLATAASARETLLLAREIGDRLTECRSWYFLGLVAHLRGEYAAARLHLGESIALARELGALWELTWALSSLAWVEISDGNHEAARPLLEEVLAVHRHIGNRLVLPSALTGLGVVELHLHGDYATGRGMVERALAIGREMGTTMWLGATLYALASFAHAEGDLARAEALHREELEFHLRTGQIVTVPVGLEGLASVAVDAGDAGRAVRLLAAADALRRRHGAPRFRIVEQTCQRTLARCRSALGEEGFAAAWEEAHRRPVEDLLDLLAEIAPGSTSPVSEDAQASSEATRQGRQAPMSDGRRTDAATRRPRLRAGSARVPRLPPRLSRWLGGDGRCPREVPGATEEPPPGGR